MQAKHELRDDRDLYKGLDPSIFTDIEKAISYDDDIDFEQGLSRQEFRCDYDGKPLSRLQKPSEIYDGKKVHHNTLCPTAKDMKEIKTDTLSGANLSRIISTINKNLSSQNNSEIRAYNASYKMVDTIVEMMRKEGMDVPSILSSVAKDILVKYYNADDAVLLQCKLSKFLASQFAKIGYIIDGKAMQSITNAAAQYNIDEICRLTKIDKEIIQEILDDAFPYIENSQSLESGQKFVRYKTKRLHFAVASIYAAARNYMPLLTKEQLINTVNNAYFETENVVHLGDLGIRTKGTNKIILESRFIEKAREIAISFPNPKDFEKELLRAHIPFSRLKRIMDKHDLHICMLKLHDYAAIPKMDADEIMKSILAQSEISQEARNDIFAASKIILNAYRKSCSTKIMVIDLSAIVFIASRLLLGNGKVKRWEASGFSPVVNRICGFLGISTNTRNKTLDQEQYNRVIIHERNPLIDAIINKLCLPQEGRLILDGNINSIIEFFIRSSRGITRIYDCRWQKKRITYDLHTITVDDLITFLDLVGDKEFDFTCIYSEKMGLSYGRGRVIRNLLLNLGVAKNTSGKMYKMQCDKEAVFRAMRQKFVEVPFGSNIVKLLQYKMRSENGMLSINGITMPMFKVNFLIKQIAELSEFTESDLIQGNKGYFDKEFITALLDVLKLLKIVHKDDAKYVSASSNHEIVQKILNINANICSQLI